MDIKIVSAGADANAFALPSILPRFIGGRKVSRLE